MNNKMQGIAVKAKIKKNAKVELRLTGRCMDPLLCAGDIAEVIDAEEYCVGNLYLFTLANGALAVHRLVLINKDLLLMKGDRTQKYEIISKRDIIGVVNRVILKGKHNWCVITPGKVSKRVVPWASRQCMFDKHVTLYHKILYRICLRINIWYGYSKRWLMVKLSS